jgi:hypothetical protein
MSKVVIAYASNFWKPGENPRDGIGLVAKANYESIVGAFPNHEAVYIDAMDYPEVRGIKDVSALFSISSSIDRLQKICKPDLTTLISVNESALLRRTIKDRARNSGTSKKYLNGHDGIYSNLNEAKNVDFILGFGAWSLFQSYTKIGIDADKVFPIGWRYWETFIDKPKVNFGNKIVAYLGAICFRKGVEKISELVFYLNKNYPDYKLELAGFAWNKTLANDLSDLLLRFPENFIWKNERIIYGENSWLELEKDSCFAIFPSFEEGLSGCAMDIINLGIPLFHSAKTGLEPSHESIRDLDFESDNWLEALGNVIDGGPVLWKNVALEQRKAAFHQNSKNNSLSRAMQRISKGYIWPKAEISEGVFSHLDKKGLNFANYINCKVNPEYTISAEISNSKNFVNVNYQDSRSINALESLQMSIYLADKYNNFSSLSFRKESGSFFDLEVIRVTNQSQPQEELNLYMSAYSNNYLSSGRSLGYLRIREFISTKIYSLKYRLVRGSNIVKLKLILILKALFAKIKA